MDRVIWVGGMGMDGKPFVLTKGLPGYVWKTAPDSSPVPDMPLWLMASMADAAKDIMKGAN